MAVTSNGTFEQTAPGGRTDVGGEPNFLTVTSRTGRTEPLGPVRPPTGAATTPCPPVSYRIALRRDVPSPEYYLMALGVLLVPPIFVTLRSAAFESRRWQESDFAGDDEEE